MFNLRLCNAATIRYSQLKFWHMHLCGMNYKRFSPQCCKCYSFGCTAAIRCGNACQGPHRDSLYSGSEHIQFNSPRLVKHEVGFPDPRRALIGSNQLWRFNDSPYYREYSCLLKAIQFRVMRNILQQRLRLGWHFIVHHSTLLNTLRPRQHDRQFQDDMLKLIFLNENIYILCTTCCYIGFCQEIFTLSLSAE